MNYKKFIINFFAFFLFLKTFLYADEIPIIVIAPGKTPQSISTVGSSVVVLDENFLRKLMNFLGDYYLLIQQV